MPKLKTAEDLAALRRTLRKRAAPLATLTLCGGTGCRASRSIAVADAIRKALAERFLEERVRIRITGCQGFCEQGPILIVDPGGIFYARVGADDAAEIVGRTVERGEVIERLLYEDPISKKRVRTEEEIPFYRGQDRVLIGQNRRIDPGSIEDYIAIDGYAALAKVLAGIAPERVIDEVERSGLRGRGGGGYPTGRKWRTCRAAKGDRRFIICNADEGDPGAYMDRCIL
ncbi:MAG: NADH-quinone oxidoreductase subunit F, partial [Planctomycetes bacterium]|nr:NADH-quinone oxidoreductase subunit F [Planctomycetota bacterium]